MDGANFYPQAEDQLISLWRYLEVYYLEKVSENFRTPPPQQTGLGTNNL